MTPVYKIAAATDDLCGEAPLWWEERRSVVWVDQGRGLVRELTEGVASVVASGFAAGGVVRNQRGDLLFTGPDGLARLSASGGFEKLPLAALADGCCLNDACADDDGQLLAGVMALCEDSTAIRGPGALVRVSAAGEVQCLDRDLGLPNGMALSPEGQSLYVVDSARRVVFLYPNRKLGNAAHSRRVFAALSPEDGVPDGLAVDAEGRVWLALWYTGQVVRLDAEGRIDLRLQLPFAQVSSLAFGGADGCDLYVTTASSPWHSVFAPRSWSDRQPQGGPLIHVRTKVPGAACRLVHSGY